MPALINIMAATGRFGGVLQPGGGGGEPVNLIPLMLDGSHTYNSGAGVSVALVDGKYTGSIAGGDFSSTTFFQDARGRLDYITLTGDGSILFGGIGVSSGATLDDYQFCVAMMANEGADFDYEFFGPDQRGPTSHTGELKKTISNQSRQDDIGANAIPTGVCDVLITKVGSAVNFYYRQVGETDEDWVLVPHNSLEGSRVAFGSTVRVGIASYGYAFGEAFTTVCDYVHVLSGSYA